jgi:uncharacterized protein with HEPN domain
VRDDRERLLDVLEAIGRIEKYAVRGREALAGEELLQTWVVWNVIAHDLPALRGRVEEILAQED